MNPFSVEPQEGNLRHNRGDDTWLVFHNGKWVAYDNEYLENQEED